MKNKITLVLSFVLITVCVFALLGSKPLLAVTDTCQGVATTFNGTMPSSVYAGQVFSITAISSRPANSYGYTITSSSLSLSATNASPASYTKNNTSTSPSPTTGASTYTSYYPNWSLTANGAVGSQIVVKLTQATADVSGIGTLTCPLTATLGTVNIIATPTVPVIPVGGTTTPTSTSSSTPAASKAVATTATPTTSQPVATPPTPTATTTQPTTISVKATVKDSPGSVKGASTSLVYKTAQVALPVVLVLVTFGGGFFLWRYIRKPKVAESLPTQPAAEPFVPQYSPPLPSQNAPVVFEPNNPVPQL
jgi:hypothetical protein